MWIINNKNWKTQKKIICNFKKAGLGPTTWKKTKSSNHLWIDGWLDHHQNQKKCGIIGKDDAQTPDDKIMFIKLQCTVQIIYVMFICRN
jgi:hypothetical protein